MNIHTCHAPHVRILCMGWIAFLAISLGGIASPITVDNVGDLQELSQTPFSGSWIDWIELLSDARLMIVEERKTTFWTTSPLAMEGSSSGIQVQALLPDETSAAVIRGSTVELWDLNSQTTLSEITRIVNKRYPAVDVSPDGQWLAATNRHNEVEMWRLEPIELVYTFTEHTANLFDVEFSPDGQWLATAGGFSGGGRADSFICIWDVSSGDLLAKFETPEIGDNHDIAFSPDGSQLATCGNEDFQIWETETWTRAYRSRSLAGGNGLRYSPNGELLALASDRGTIYLLGTEDFRIKGRLRMGSAVSDVSFSQDGSLLAAAVRDGTLRLYGIP